MWSERDNCEVNRWMAAASEFNRAAIELQSQKQPLQNLKDKVGEAAWKYLFVLESVEKTVSEPLAYELINHERCRIGPYLEGRIAIYWHR